MPLSAGTRLRRRCVRPPIAQRLRGFPAMPLVGRNATRHVMPFSNAMGGFIFRYAQLYAQIAGTSPTITLASWLSTLGI